MEYGISGAPLPSGLLYGVSVTAGCNRGNGGFSPMVAYAIAYRETIRGQRIGLWPSAAEAVSNDGGHGLCQITPEAWWSDPMLREWSSCDWADPATNVSFAVRYFMMPAMIYWAGRGEQGDALVKLIACEFNAGRSAVIAAHLKGDADKATTGHDYGADVLSTYHVLLNGQCPN